MLKRNAYLYMVRQLAFPAPPPPMVWSGGGGVGGVCEEGSGPLLPIDGGMVLGAARVTRKPYTSHKPYNVARAPVF